MSVTAVSFRASFPAFADTTKYPDAAINFWLGIANIMLLTSVWGVSSPTADNPPTALIDYGAALFVAHQLAVEQQNQKIVAAGGVPGAGGAGAIVSSQSVGGVSRSYDTAAGLLDNGCPWNLTNYGTRFLYLARMAGKGGYQLGAGCGGAQRAWSGPVVGFW